MFGGSCGCVNYFIFYFIFHLHVTLLWTIIYIVNDNLIWSKIMRKTTTEEWVVSAIKYCRQHGWAKTRDQLWQNYHSRVINAEQFKRISEVLQAKGLAY